jgi:hypothetical protein
MKPFAEGNFSSRPENPDDHKVFALIFNGFTEISNSFEALKLSEVLISIAPPRSKKIQKSEYLKYLVSMYLQEVYILKERLNTYATRIKRLYVRSKGEAAVAESISAVFERVKNSLEGIITTRGSHVHSFRFTDDELDNLTQMELIYRFNQGYEIDFHLSYVKAKRVWKQRISENNIATGKLLNFYFGIMSEIIGPDGLIVMP